LISIQEFAIQGKSVSAGGDNCLMGLRTDETPLTQPPDLLPLLVVAGAVIANDETCEQSHLVFDNSSDIGNHSVSGYLFGSL
jgi:hypothetical protein